MTPIERFVGRLSRADPPPPFINPYRHQVPTKNLLRFLQFQRDLSSTILLVGEAPGYRGAVRSGVPLTSLAILTEDWGDPWNAFGSRSGYIEARPSRFRREATATMVWRALATHASSCSLPLTWNAVPFHPRGPMPHSNASLKSTSVTIGSPWLCELLSIFPNAIPVAVGRRAGEALAQLNISHASVRHPSRGGKAQFDSGLNDVVSCLRIG